MVTYDGDPRHGKVKAIDPGYRTRIERFLEFSQAAGITHIGEGEPDYDEFAEWLRGLIPSEAAPQTIDHGPRTMDQRSIEELDLLTTSFTFQGL